MYLIAFIMGPEFYGHPIGKRITGAQEWIFTYKGKRGWPVYNLPPPAGVAPGLTYSTCLICHLPVSIPGRRYPQDRCV